MYKYQDNQDKITKNDTKTQDDLIDILEITDEELYEQSDSRFVKIFYDILLRNNNKNNKLIICDLDMIKAIIHSQNDYKVSEWQNHPYCCIIALDYNITNKELTISKTVGIEIVQFNK